MEVFCFLSFCVSIVAACLHMAVLLGFETNASIRFDDSNRMFTRFLYIRREYVRIDDTWVDPHNGKELPYPLRDRAVRLLALRAKS